MRIENTQFCRGGVGEGVVFVEVVPTIIIVFVIAVCLRPVYWYGHVNMFAESN